MITLAHAPEVHTVQQHHQDIYPLAFRNHLLARHAAGRGFVTPPKAWEATALHDTRRGAGGSFVRTEGGKPAMLPSFVGYLDRSHRADLMSWDVLEAAILAFEVKDPEAGQVLRWRMQPFQERKRRGGRMWMAHQLQVDHTMLSRLVDRAVEGVWYELPMDVRVAMWREER